MRIDIVSLFPDLFRSFLAESLMAKALEKKVIQINLINPRDFTVDKHHMADDRPYGGGPGMVLKAEPLVAAVESLKPAKRGAKKPRVIYLSPSGRRLDQALVAELAACPHLALICGRYEGIDSRAVEVLGAEEISIGDYVVNGGEVPAMVLAEAVARLQPGFMGRLESADEESHSQGLLEYPHYTRPEDFRGLKVPGVLLSGDHRQVALWRLKKSLERTLNDRPELLAKADLTGEGLKMLTELNKMQANAPRDAKKPCK